MGWIVGLVIFLIIAVAMLFNVLDVLSRIPRTKFGVMLILASIFPMYIVLKQAFTDASDKDINRDWGIYCVILVIMVLVGVLSLFF